MLTQAIAFVLDALFHLFIVVALVRFWMQALGAPARNPIAQFTMALTDFAVKLADQWLAPLGFEVGSPRDAAARGAHLAIRHPEAWPICRALIEQANVVPDFRQPDILRLGLSPMTTRFADIWDGMDRLHRIVERGDHQALAGAVRRVT